MVNLIKCGAFDEFGDRRDIMEEYINIISDTKKKLTLQNVATLIEHKLFPDEFDFQCRVFNFNKYLRKFKDKNTDENILNDIIPTFDGCDCTVVIYQSQDRQSGFVISGTTFRLVNVSDEKRRLYISGEELRWM